MPLIAHLLITHSPESCSDSQVLTSLVPCVLCPFTSWTSHSHSPNPSFPPSHFLPPSCLSIRFTPTTLYLSPGGFLCAPPTHFVPLRRLPVTLPTLSFPQIPLVLFLWFPFPFLYPQVPPFNLSPPHTSSCPRLPLSHGPRRPAVPRVPSLGLPSHPPRTLSAPSHPPPISHSPSPAAAPPSPMVEMKVVLKASSEKRNRRQVLPTPESPISSSLNR